jgi:hypothetical protein
VTHEDKRKIAETEAVDTPLSSGACASMIYFIGLTPLSLYLTPLSAFIPGLGDPEGGLAEDGFGRGARSQRVDRTVAIHRVESGLRDEDLARGRVDRHAMGGGGSGRGRRKGFRGEAGLAQHEVGILGGDESGRPAGGKAQAQEEKRAAEGF